MTFTRGLIGFFWLIIAIALFVQFSDYNRKADKEMAAHAPPPHFFITPLVLPTSTSSGSDPHNHAAEVHQVSFWTKGDTPTPGSFTAYFTLKNQGGAKAVGVQIFVRPYRGISLRNTDRRMNSVSPDRLSDDDPLSQFGQWVGFPNLAPGESSTQSFVFLNRGNVSPGDNPNPQIDFETEKGKP